MLVLNNTPHSSDGNRLKSFNYVTSTVVRVSTKPYPVDSCLDFSLKIPAQA